MEIYLEEQPIEVDAPEGRDPPGDPRHLDDPGARGSSFKNKGVQPLLDAVLDYLPSPLDVPPVEGLEPVKGEDEGSPATREAADEAAVRGARLQGHVRPVRRQAHLLPRLLGQARGGRPRAERGHRPHRARRAHPDDARERPRGAGPRSTRATSPRASVSSRPRRATRCVRRTPRSCSRRSRSRTRSCTSRSSRRPRSTRRRWASPSSASAEEDPTFQVRTDEETGQTIISGMGELHLEVIVDRMKREFKVEAAVGRPQVAYRETVRSRRDQGRGQVRPPDRRLGPVRRGLHRPRAGARRGLRLRQQDQGRLGSRRSSSRRSRRASRRRSRRASRPATRWSTCVRRLIDGKYHDTDSSEIAFKVAGSLALKEAARRAKPVLLEPVMAVEVVGARRSSWAT